MTKGARPGQWVCTIFSLPATVAGEGRPDVVMWLDAASRFILGTQLCVAGRGSAEVVPLLRESMAKHGVTPTSIRVASRELAAVLGAALPAIEIVVGAVPEANEAIADLKQHLRKGPVDDGGWSYFDGGASPAQVAAFCAASARVYRVTPWRVMPADSYMAVACEALGITEGALNVVGQQGQSYGWVLFSSVVDVETYIEASIAYERGEPPGFPRHYMMSFDTRAAAGRMASAELKRYAFEIAGPAAIPSAFVLDPAAGLSPLSPVELAGITAVADALAAFVASEPALRDAWEHRAVRATASSHGVKLAAPCWPPRRPLELAALGILDDDGALDPAQFERHRDAVLDRFLDAPEGAGFAGHGGSLIIAELAHARGRTIAEATPIELRACLLDELPRRALVEPGEADEIVREVRALLAFVARELGSATAQRCLDRLPADASAQLAAALADPRRFSPTKQMLLEGRAAGFDITTEAGIAAWFAVLDGRAAKPRKKPAAKRSKR